MSRTPSPSPPAPVVVFDLDGTLVRTMHHFADLAARILARRFGVDRAEARRRYLETSGAPFVRQLPHIVPDAAPDAADAAVTDFEDRKRAICRTVRIERDDRAALRDLRDSGVDWCISSNNTQAMVDEFVAREALAPRAALGFERGIGKGRHHFDRIAARLGASRDHMVFVGDSISDAAVAQRCGVRFVARLGTFTREQFRRASPHSPCVTRLAEILPLVVIP